jgi:asparagine synthase (glutamine-hydrolysing)
MLASLEMRAPFLDRTVIEFAFARVPDSLRATSSQRKVLTRRLAEKLLPPDLDTTRKQGFSIPLDAWFRNSWGNVMTEILEAAPRELFNPRAIRRLIDKQYRGANNAHRLFALTIFELWRRHYRISL